MICNRRNPRESTLARHCPTVVTATLAILAILWLRTPLVEGQEAIGSLPSCPYSRQDILVPSPNYSTDRTLYWLLDDGAIRICVLRSTDAGNTWLQVYDHPMVGGTAWPYFFAIEPTEESSGLVAYLGVLNLYYPSDEFLFYRTSDGGDHWEERTSPCSTLFDCNRFALHTTNRPGTLFQPRRWSTSSGLPEGVVRSNDGGASWQQVWSETPALTIAVSPNFDQDETLYASLVGVSAKLNSRLIISYDAGETWHGGGQGLCPDTYVPDLVISPGFARDRTLLASPYRSSLFMSLDAGMTWRAIFPSGSPPYCGDQWRGTIRAQFSPDFPEDSTIYAATDRGLYVSYDAGQSWVFLVQSAEAGDFAVHRTPNPPETAKHAQGFNDWRKAVANSLVFLPYMAIQGSGPPLRSHTLFLRISPPNHYSTQYRSDDGGRTWQCMERPSVRTRAYLPLLRVRS